MTIVGCDLHTRKQQVHRVCRAQTGHTRGGGSNLASGEPGKEFRMVHARGIAEVNSVTAGDLAQPLAIIDNLLPKQLLIIRSAMAMRVEFKIDALA